MYHLDLRMSHPLAYVVVWSYRLQLSQPNKHPLAENVGCRCNCHRHFFFFSFFFPMVFNIHRNYNYKAYYREGVGDGGSGTYDKLSEGSMTSCPRAPTHKDQRDRCSHNHNNNVKEMGTLPVQSNLTTCVLH